jgi:hypothetical protein
MTQLSDQDRHIAKIDNVAEAGWDDSIDDVAAEHGWSAPSGRDAFWTTTRPGGWFTRSLLDAGEAPSPASDGDGVTLGLSVDLADQWDRRDLLRD